MATPPRNENERAKQVRDIGIYTAIPAMMLVGPVLGWLAGRWAGNRWGHDATFETVGALLGFVAAVRQVQLIFQRQSGKRDGDGS